MKQSTHQNNEGPAAMEKTASLKSISEKMSQIPKESFRYHVLQCARSFKTSWIQLGQALYTVWRDKSYRGWGYLTFEGYITSEIGIKKMTAMKLLRSYSFLEREEPKYISKDAQPSSIAHIPSVEAVDMLRKVKEKEGVSDDDYTKLKTRVMDEGLDARSLKKEVTSFIRPRQELPPEEAKRQSDRQEIRKILGTLKSIRRDLEIMKLLPADVLDRTEELVKRIEEIWEERYQD